MSFLCTIYAPGAFGGQKGVSDFLEVELIMVVGCHVGLGNQTQVLSGKATSVLNR